MLEDLTKIASEFLGYNPVSETPPRRSAFFIDEYAEEAAKNLVVTWDIDPSYNPATDHPADAPEPRAEAESAMIDVTDAVADSLNEWGYGSSVQSFDGDLPDIHVELDKPSMYIVDADGRPIEGARIVATFGSVELEVNPS